MTLNVIQGHVKHCVTFVISRKPLVVGLKVYWSYNYSVMEQFGTSAFYTVVH